MAATLADYSVFDDLDVFLSIQWPVMARCVQALGPYFQSKIATGTEPLDVLHGQYLGIAGQSTTIKDWRFEVDATNNFIIQENTGTDAVPVWVTRFQATAGGGGSGPVSPHASTHQHGGVDEVATATPGANAIIKATSGSRIGTGWLTGVITDAEVAASAAIARTKLLAMNASRAAVSDASGFLATAATTSTEIGFVSGVTSAIQTQLGTKLNLSGGVMSGTLDMDGQQIFMTADQAGRIDGGGGSLFRVLNSASTVFRCVTGGFFDFFDADAGAGRNPQLRLFRTSASPAAADLLGTVAFLGNDSGGNTTNYAEILAVLVDPTDTSEDGQLDFNIIAGGAFNVTARINGTGVNLPVQTASRAAALDASKNVVSVNTTLAELNFVNGVTSAIQTQLDARSVLLATYTPSGASSVDINSVFSGTYTTYVIDFSLRVSVDDSEIHFRTDTSNGVSFDTGASDYSFASNTFSTGSSNVDVVSTGFGQIVLGSSTVARAVGNATNEGIQGRLIVQTGSASIYPLITGHGTYLDPSTVLHRWLLGGTRLSAATINAFQILPQSGTLTGTVKVYGMP